MKKFLTAFLLSVSIALSAQHAGFNYQGVVKTAAGVPIANQIVSLHISIVSGPSDSIHYKEVHEVTTDKSGVFSVIVGQGSVSGGAFENIPWTHADLWLKTAMDAGSGLEEMGKSKIVPVPIALYSLKTMYDYRLSSSVETNAPGYPGVTLPYTIYLSSYMYDHEPVDVTITDIPAGISIDTTHFSTTGQHKSIKATYSGDLPPGIYYATVNGVSKSGRKRQTQIKFEVVPLPNE
jgi:hypothetical protein